LTHGEVRRTIPSVRGDLSVTVREPMQALKQTAEAQLGDTIIWLNAQGMG
jgi:hypothetical protein